MATKRVWFGPILKTVESLDVYPEDGKVMKGIRSELPISVEAAPVDPTDVLRKVDLTGYIQSPVLEDYVTETELTAALGALTAPLGVDVVVVQNIDDPRTELSTKVGVAGKMIIVIQAPIALTETQSSENHESTIYQYCTNPSIVMIPSLDPLLFATVVAGPVADEYWVAVAGKYKFGSAVVHGQFTAETIVAKHGVFSDVMILSPDATTAAVTKPTTTTLDGGVKIFHNFFPPTDNAIYRIHAEIVAVHTDVSNIVHGGIHILDFTIARYGGMNATIGAIVYSAPSESAVIAGASAYVTIPPASPGASIALTVTGVADKTIKWVLDKFEYSVTDNVIPA
jgi:hypothetical protein